METGKNRKQDEKHLAEDGITQCNDCGREIKVSEYEKYSGLCRGCYMYYKTLARG